MTRYADERRAKPGRTCATCGKRTRHIASHAIREHARYDAPHATIRAAIAAARGGIAR